MSARILLAAGGTGGHVNPALATAEALRRRGIDVEFVGTAAGLEARLVPAAGFRLHEIRAAPFRRTASLATARLPVTLLRAAAGVRRLARQREVVAACAFGGYVSGPLMLAALGSRMPLVLHEQNAVPGLANRLAARWARAIAISVPDAAEAFARPERTVLTGNPVRSDLADVDIDRAGLRDEAVAAFQLDPQRSTLLVFGGSLGAKRINDALLASVQRWQNPEEIQVLHIAGSRDHVRVRDAWEEALAGSALLVRCLEFTDRMDLAYAVADAVLCRAGASSIAELTALGVPALLVPYPHAVADEQTANARALAGAGGAVVVADADLDDVRLVAECEPVLTDPDRRARMTAAAKELGRPDAAERVADLVVAVAGIRGQQEQT